MALAISAALQPLSRGAASSWTAGPPTPSVATTRGRHPVANDTPPRGKCYDGLAAQMLHQPFGWIGPLMVTQLPQAPALGAAL